MNETKLSLAVALTLALIVESSWEETDLRDETGKTKIRRAWKGLDLDILDNLEQRGLIRASKGSRSMQVMPEGFALGKKLAGDHNVEVK